jgi:hypothetical protein
MSGRGCGLDAELQGANAAFSAWQMPCCCTRSNSISVNCSTDSDKVYPRVDHLDVPGIGQMRLEPKRTTFETPIHEASGGYAANQISKLS